MSNLACLYSHDLNWFMFVGDVLWLIPVILLVLVWVSFVICMPIDGDHCTDCLDSIFYGDGDLVTRLDQNDNISDLSSISSSTRNSEIGSDQTDVISNSSSTNSSTTLSIYSADYDHKEISAIDHFPMIVLGESRQLPRLNQDTCAICLGEYEPKDTLRIVPVCNHYFHAQCIDPWLKLNFTCPLCRKSQCQWWTRFVFY